MKIKKYLSLLTIALRRLTRKREPPIPTPLELLTPKQDNLDTSKAAQKYRSLKVKSPRRTRKKYTTRKCLETNKVMRSELGAKARAKELNLRAYPCQFCERWHLTHKPNKLRFH